jgi:CxxC-x17-CxxC domain-containing protein
MSKFGARKFGGRSPKTYGRQRRESSGFGQSRPHPPGGQESEGFRRRESPGFDRRESGGFRKPGKPQMHTAVCAKCGESCEVPFRPYPNKSVYCSNCYEKDDSPRRSTKPASLAAEINQINQKLDRILQALNLE